MYSIVSSVPYISLSVVSVLITAGFFALGWMMQRRTLRRVFCTRNIAITAVLVALSVVLTNLVGYSISLGSGGIIRLALGNFIIFMIGMLFGPVMGMTGGLLADLIGLLISSNGIPVLSFTMDKALFGFVGSLVFLWKNNKWLIGKTSLIFGLYFLIHTFIIFPISMSVITTKELGIFLGITKLITTPVELAIYIPITIIGFELCVQLLQRMISKKDFIWAFRHGPIHFKKRKSKYERQLVHKAKLESKKEEKTEIVNK